MRFNRFVFLNRPMLSLETHLGVTTSPQPPFPTDYVPRSVSDQSPPLRLTPSRSRRRSCSATSTSTSLNLHSRHAQATRPPYRRASLARRAAGEGRGPRPVSTLGGVVAEKVGVDRVRPGLRAPPLLVVQSRS